MSSRPWTASVALLLTLGPDVRLNLPLIGQFPAGNPPDAGLQPDVLVVQTVRDIPLERDAELEAVRVRARLANGAGETW